MNPSVSERGTNFSVAEIGAIDAWKSYTAEIKGLPGVEVSGKLFLNPILGLTGMEVSVNYLPAGAAVPFYHKHHLALPAFPTVDISRIGHDVRKAE